MAVDTGAGVVMVAVTVVVTAAEDLVVVVVDLVAEDLAAEVAPPFLDLDLVDITVAVIEDMVGERPLSLVEWEL